MVFLQVLQSLSLYPTMLNFVLTVLEQLIAKQVSARMCYGCSRVVLSYYICIYTYVCAYVENVYTNSLCKHCKFHACNYPSYWPTIFSRSNLNGFKHSIDTSIYCRVVRSFIDSPSLL